jgi:hypothetical protein
LKRKRVSIRLRSSRVSFRLLPYSLLQPVIAFSAHLLAALAANPRVHGTFFAPTPFFGGAGMIPACPKSRATVSDGCAPTLSQYLRFSTGDFRSVPARERDEDVGTNEEKNEGRPRERLGEDGRGRTWHGRSSSPCVCSRRSLPVEGDAGKGRSVGCDGGGRSRARRPSRERLGMRGR